MKHSGLSVHPSSFSFVNSYCDTQTQSAPLRVRPAPSGFLSSVCHSCLQPFQVVATESLNPVALEADVDGALATEKLDGTCCYVTVYKGQPHLWARLDRKPNKQADRRFKKYQHAHRSSKGGFLLRQRNVVTSAVGEAVLEGRGMKRQLFPTRSGFTWNVEEDFKTVPGTWIAAHGVKHVDGQPVPDEHGHIPG